jgi:hypothetical protein
VQANRQLLPFIFIIRFCNGQHDNLFNLVSDPAAVLLTYQRERPTCRVCHMALEKNDCAMALTRDPSRVTNGEIQVNLKHIVKHSIRHAQGQYCLNLAREARDFGHGSTSGSPVVTSYKSKKDIGCPRFHWTRGVVLIGTQCHCKFYADGGRTVVQCHE